MAQNSSIEWTDHTWSPWEGCQKVGPGCDHCYAEARNQRFAKGANWGPWAPRRKTKDWSKPYAFDRAAANAGERRRLFPSLCDPFDNAVDPRWRAEFFLMLAGTPNLDHLLLTKRVGNAAEMISDAVGAIRAELPMVPAWPWPNVWLGATVVNQAEADRDIPKLLAVPARVRFLSIEPMLGPITLPGFNATTSWCPLCQKIVADSLMRPHEGEHGTAALPCSSVYDLLHWVICGGESGPGARPMHPDWARSLRDQCVAAGVPFLFKQWGEWTPAESIDDNDDRDLAQQWLARDGHEVNPDHGVDFFHGDTPVYRAGKKAAGRLLDGVEHNGFPG